MECATDVQSIVSIMLRQGQELHSFQCSVKSKQLLAWIVLHLGPALHCYLRLCLQHCKHYSDTIHLLLSSVGVAWYFLCLFRKSLMSFVYVRMTLPMFLVFSSSLDLFH